ncbi:MAG: hypothetical protein WBQ53_16745 [Methylocystis sp.]
MAPPPQAVRSPFHEASSADTRNNTMAKGQQRSNREQKKPKKDKAKTPAGGTAAASAAWSTIDKIQGKDAGKKK